MQNLWNDDEAAAFATAGELGLRVYSSRLLGRDPSLVLHGGGNTSLKHSEADVFGQPQEILYIKGSGWDLEKIEAAGFSPVLLDHARRLGSLPSLSDPAMVNELVSHMTRAGAPNPSVETILHALLPYRYVDHTHADAVLTISNTADGEAQIRELYGDSVVVIPYCMPGFDLARLVAERFPREVGPNTIGMVLLNHGVFSFGDSARQSYDRMIELVARAEDWLQARQAWTVSLPPPPAATAAQRLARAELRAEISRVAGKTLLLLGCADDTARAFAAQPAVTRLAGQGPVTPDHVIRTKRVALFGRDVASYAADYGRYFAEYRSRAKSACQMLDPAPRVVLDAEFGLCTVGSTVAEAQIVQDIYRRSITTFLRGEALGGYQALPAADLFDVEYWDLEQAKLRKKSATPPLQGGIALVTGAASGIGKATVSALLARGAAVIALDRDAGVHDCFPQPEVLAQTCDITDAAAVEAALEAGVRRFGGLDMLVLNAGIFPAGARIDALSDDLWRQVFAVNLDANLRLLRLGHPLLKRAPGGGRVVVIGSKNVPAPGPGAAAYSASKAALTQLMRVAALEWGADGIRINALHPNAVFDTGLWTDEVLASRAQQYGLSVADYKRNNVLQTEVGSRHVAELAAEMCGPLFACTTGAQLPVDGGNDRVI